MIVIKPIVIDNAKLTSSTIPEPDVYTNEVEWAQRGEYAIANPVNHLSSDGTGFWCRGQGAPLPTTTIYQLDKDFAFTGFSFDISADINLTIDGLEWINGFIYVIDRAHIVRKYTEAGVNTGFSFDASAQITSGGSMFWDGSFINLQDFFGPNVRRYSLEGLFVDTVIMPITPMIGTSYTSDGVNVYVAESYSTSVYAISIKTNAVVYSFGFSSQTSQGQTGFEGITFSGLAILNGRLYGSTGYRGFEYSKAGEFGGGYEEGSVLIKTATNKKYQATTYATDDPEVGVSIIPPSWVEVSPTNRHAEFDDVVGTQSLSSTSQIVEVDPGEIIGGLAVINISGVLTVNITMTDPIEGEVYNRDISLDAGTDIVDWYSYLWSAFDYKTEFVVLDLPPYSSATVKLTFTGPAEIGVGVIVMGPVVKIGVTNHGTNVQQLDFSLYEEDQFGNVKVTPRPYAKLVNFKNTVQKQNLTYVYNQLEQLRGVAAVWVGDETNENDLTLVYGSHRDNTLNIDTPTDCNVPLQIRGRT